MRDAEAPIKEHHTGEGSTIFKHACALGCEGIVSKRLGSPYRSGSNRSLGESQKPGGSRKSRARPRKSAADKPELLRRKGQAPVEGPAPPLPWPWSRTRRQRRLGRRWKLCLACSVRL